MRIQEQNYTAQLTGEIEEYLYTWEDGQKGWLKRYIVGIYDTHGDKIGQYTTSGHKGVRALFVPILRDNKWWALISNGSKLSVLSLPDCKEVMEYKKIKSAEVISELYCPLMATWNEEYTTTNKEKKPVKRKYPVVVIGGGLNKEPIPDYALYRSLKVAFVSSFDSHCGGNYVNILDISEVANGNITDLDSYDCPDWLPLKDCVNLKPLEHGGNIEIAQTLLVNAEIGGESNCWVPEFDGINHRGSEEILG